MVSRIFANKCFSVVQLRVVQSVRVQIYLSERETRHGRSPLSSRVCTYGVRQRAERGLRTRIMRILSTGYDDDDDDATERCKGYRLGDIFDNLSDVCATCR